MHPKPRVLVAARHGSHRLTVAAFFESRGHDVLFAESGSDAIAAVQAGAVDLVVTAHTMPGICGYELTRTLRVLFPRLPVILMSIGDDSLSEALLEDAAALGALNVPKDGEAREDGARSLAVLTQRETQVLDLIVKGHGNKAIARILEISPRTVENHRAQIMRKTMSRNVAALVRLTLMGGDAMTVAGTRAPGAPSA